MFRLPLTARAALPNASSSLRAGSRRAYASAPPPAAGAKWAMPLSLAGLAGLGTWYSLGGFGDVKPIAAEGKSALNKDEWREFTLKEVKPYNHDSSFFIFELPKGEDSGLSVASAVVFKSDAVKDDKDKPVIRPYTPTSAPDTPGHIDFLIKKYKDGKMTEFVHGMQPGDKLSIKGPIPKFPYKANEFEEIAMIAGGSGITPMWQIMQQISGDKSDKTKVTLIYSNKTQADILLREEFDALAKKDSRFKIVYGLDKKDKSSPADTFEGYVTPEVLSKYLPAPAKADKVKIFVCGPPPQVAAISGGKGPKGSQGELKGLLADAGFQPDQVYKF